ncbi:unnamed protein product [Parajaminaea phylloscopi]
MPKPSRPPLLPSTVQLSVTSKANARQTLQARLVHRQAKSGGPGVAYSSPEVGAEVSFVSSSTAQISHEAMLTSADDEKPRYTAAQPQLRARQDDAGSVSCPVCRRDVQCASAWELARHVYDAHRREHPLPWAGSAMKAEMANVLAWVNEWLKRQRSPLAIASHRREYEARTSRHSPSPITAGNTRHVPPATRRRQSPQGIRGTYLPHPCQQQRGGVQPGPKREQHRQQATKGGQAAGLGPGWGAVPKLLRRLSMHGG